MSENPESSQSAEKSPQERIRASLETIMGDPERVMAAERGPRGEDPLVLNDLYGNFAARFLTTISFNPGDGPLVVIEVQPADKPKGYHESYNYTVNTGDVLFTPATVHDARLDPEASIEKLADTLDDLAVLWQQQYGVGDQEF